MNAIQVFHKSMHSDTFANLLHTTDFHFLQEFFVTSPSSENQQKSKAAILLKPYFTKIYLVIKLTFKQIWYLQCFHGFHKFWSS